MNTPQSNSARARISTPTTPSTPTNRSFNSDSGSRLDVILKQVTSWHERWLAAQKRGCAIISSIEAIKNRAIIQKEKDENADLYPIELLTPHCSNLSTIMTIFEDAVNNLRLFRKQLLALSKLEEESIVPYKTWNLIRFCNFTDEVLTAYEMELKIKTIVTENIAYSTTRSELAWHNLIWQYPTYVNKHIDFLFECLKIETT